MIVLYFIVLKIGKGQGYTEYELTTLYVLFYICAKLFKFLLWLIVTKMISEQKDMEIKIFIYS